MDPGIKVNTRSKNNFMPDVYFINNQYRVYRDIALRNVTLSGVRKLDGTREMD